MIYGYIRVSTDMQTVENQRYEIQRFADKEGLVIDDWIEETISGAKMYSKRALGKLLKKAQKDDFIIASEISRLGRSLFMIMEILNICMTKEIRVWTIKDNYRLGDDIQSKVLAFAFGLSAEIERNLISQRTKEALARKKAEGMQLGHKQGERLRLNPKCVAKHDWIVQQLDAKVEKTIIAKKLKVSICTLYRYLVYTNLFTPTNCKRECWIKDNIYH
jgi:DNA invertase Pin-like site-specific DNA recombinase